MLFFKSLYLWVIVLLHQCLSGFFFQNSIEYGFWYTSIFVTQKQIGHWCFSALSPNAFLYSILFNFLDQPENYTTPVSISDTNVVLLIKPQDSEIKQITTGIFDLYLSKTCRNQIVH